MEQRHLDQIRTRLAPLLSPRERSLLPRRYELVGDILLLSLPAPLHARRHDIAEAYREALGVASVMGKERVAGEFRQPGHELLCGDRTTTVHRENGISYEIDLSELMFSAGTIAARIRMGSYPDAGLTLDMFAGIGYFTLPMARHAGAHVIALEKNPVSYRYLCRNIARNRVSHLVEARNIDCRDYDGPPVSRIVMGYVQTTNEFLGAALSFADDTCLVHYHQTVPAHAVEDTLSRELSQAAHGAGRALDVLGVRVIKKYSPGVVHAVADAQITKIY